MGLVKLISKALHANRTAGYEGTHPVQARNVWRHKQNLKED